MQAAQLEKAELTKKLENYDRDRAALRRSKMRSESSKGQLDEMRWELELLRMQCEQLTKERDLLRVRFEEAIVDVQQNVGIKNVLLERKLGLMQKEVDKREVVLGEVLTVAGLEPTLLSQKMEHLLRVKNGKIKTLQSELSRLSDIVEELVVAYESKMVEFGIPKDVAASLRPIFN